MCDENLDVSQMVTVTQKQGKFYAMKTHPLRPNIIFCGTNFGLLHFKMDVNRIPNFAIGINVPLSMPSAQPDFKSTNFGNARTGNRSLFYYKDKAVMQRNSVVMSGQECYSDPFKVVDLQRYGNVIISTSPSGKYLCVLWESDAIYTIFRTDQWKAIAHGNQTLGMVWAPTMDRVAILKQVDKVKKAVTILSVENNS